LILIDYWWLLPPFHYWYIIFSLIIFIEIDAITLPLFDYFIIDIDYAITPLLILLIRHYWWYYWHYFIHIIDIIDIIDTLLLIDIIAITPLLILHCYLLDDIRHYSLLLLLLIIHIFIDYFITHYWLLIIDIIDIIDDIAIAIMLLLTFSPHYWLLFHYWCHYWCHIIIIIIDDY
jgi:hypothetical protein